MADRLETASAFGLALVPDHTGRANLSAIIDFDPHLADIERLIDAWLPLTFAINSINRSMGLPISIRSCWCRRSSSSWRSSMSAFTMSAHVARPRRGCVPLRQA
jgi:hypothetical protein